MKIVLLERVEKLGKMGELVNVKNGYARNYLFPTKKALRATEENIAYFDKQRAVLEAQSKDMQTKAEGTAKLLENVKIYILRQSSENGILYGSVSRRDIAKELSLHHQAVDVTQVYLDQPLKNRGIHKVQLNLHPEVSTSIIVSIAPSEDEAKMQITKAEKNQKAKESAEMLEQLEAADKAVIDGP